MHCDPADLIERAYRERNLGNRERALGLYEEAAAVARQAGDTWLTAHALRHIADLERERGHGDEAEANAREALALYRRKPDEAPLEIANTIRILALVAQGAGRREEALRLWREGREGYERARVAAGVAECAARIAELSGESGPTPG